MVSIVATGRSVVHEMQQRLVKPRASFMSNMWHLLSTLAVSDALRWKADTNYPARGSAN